MINNRRGGFMTIYLPVMILFMCGLAITLQVVQIGDIENSMVSLFLILDLEDKQELFEFWEQELILEASKDNWDEGVKTESKFCELYVEDDFRYKHFIFVGLVVDGVERKIKEEDKEQFCKDVYDFNYVDGKLKVNRGELRKSFRLEPEEKDKIYFVVDFEYVFDKNYEFEKGGLKKISVTSSIAERTRLIFIPVNWNLGEQRFNEAMNLQYDYFLSLLDKDKRDEFEKLSYFDNLEYEFGGGQYAVDLVEEKIVQHLKDYDRNEDFVVVLIPEMADENVLGHVWGQFNIVLVKYDSTRTLAHELGHAIWGLCEEYSYLDVFCGKEEFEEEVRQQIIDNSKVYFSFLSELESEKININIFLEGLSNSGKFTGEFLENILDCDIGGWLFQNYINPKPGVLSCPNPYPRCCLDSQNYAGDNNLEGVNCLSGISKEEAENRLCAGSSCGKDCRSIMGVGEEFDNEYPV